MTKLEQKVEELFKQDINPALAMHEGSVTLKSIRETDDLAIVLVNFHGACSGCDSSRGGTLVGIQEYLKEELNMPNLLVVNEGT